MLELESLSSDRLYRSEHVWDLYRDCSNEYHMICGYDLVSGVHVQMSRTPELHAFQPHA